MRVVVIGPLRHASHLGAKRPEAEERAAERHVQVGASAVVGPEVRIQFLGLVQGVDVDSSVAGDPDVVVLAEFLGVEPGRGGTDGEVP